MPTYRRPSRLLAAALAAGAIAVVAVAVPALGQAGPGRAPTAVAPAASEKPGKGPKADKVPEKAVSLSGKVGTRADAEGKTVYTLAVGGTVYDLEAGPAWFWGDNHPLKDLVGKSVTIEGDQAEGSTSIDVRVADGKTLRAAGKPAWAGGWKVVGERHPGWAPWKLEKQNAKDKAGHGRPEWAGPKGSGDPDADD